MAFFIYAMYKYSKGPLSSTQALWQETIQC